MTMLPPTEGLSRADPSLWDRLRESFERAGYTEEVLGFAETIAPGLFDSLRVPAVRWELENRGDPAALLASLLAYDGRVERGKLKEILGDGPLDGLVSAGLLEAVPQEPGRMRALFRVIPIEGMWILSDPPSADPACVMGPGPTTKNLLRAMPASIEGEVLDIGCGAGTLALAALRRGASGAAGTDINPRAVEMARLNALLNARPAAEFFCGNLADPVPESRFSLVVSQPPYVVCPPGTSRVTYLHGGEGGDEIALEVMRVLPERLAPGGRALLLMDVAVREDPPLHRRLRSVLGDAPLDLLILAAPGAPPALQAVGYGILERPDLGAGYAEVVHRYQAHFRSRGIDRFAHALIAVRAGSGPGPRNAATLTLSCRTLPREDLGELERLWRAVDLAALPDEALRRTAVRVSRHSRWVEERSRPDPKEPPVYKVRFLSGAIARDQEMPEAGYILNQMLDAAESVGGAVTRYAEVCQAAEEEVQPQVLQFVREGLARGILEPG